MTNRLGILSLLLFGSATCYAFWVPGQKEPVLCKNALSVFSRHEDAAPKPVSRERNEAPLREEPNPPADIPQEHFDVPVTGLVDDIHYKTAGEQNKETVILMHGAHSSSWTWKHMIPKLAEKYRVVALDFPGEGETPESGKDYSTVRMAYELKNLMDKLHIKKAHLIGHSYGGKVGLRFGQLFPDRTLSIVVADMGVKFPHYEGPDYDLDDWDFTTSDQSPLVEAVPIDWNRRFPNVKFGGEPEFEDAPIDWSHNEPAPKDDALERVPAKESHWPKGLITEVGSEDLTSALKWMKPPVLFVAPKESLFLGNWEKQWIQNLRPDVPIEVVNEKGHAVHKTPGFLDAVRPFLEANKEKPGVESGRP